MKVPRGRFPKKGYAAMRKGTRFGGVTGNYKGFKKYFNKKKRKRKNFVSNLDLTLHKCEELVTNLDFADMGIF
jgi:hypothetical protein